MRVFVTGTGRCGTSTFHESCRHITNFTSGHESRKGQVDLGQRVQFPGHHIEIDPHFCWYLERLVQSHPDALFVHLVRDKEAVVDSWYRRGGNGVFGAYSLASITLQADCYSMNQRQVKAAFGSLYDSMVERIDSTFRLSGVEWLRVDIANLPEWLPRFWERIGAEGNLQQAQETAGNRHNEFLPDSHSRETSKAVEHDSVKIKLEIGPGDHPQKGFLTLDCEAKRNPDFHCHWGQEPIPIPGDICSEVYASHVLEHVPWIDTVQALKEVRRVLEPGGLLEIWVPDFAYIVKCYQERRCGDNWRRFNPQGDFMRWVNGRIFTYGPEESNFHRAAFDFDSLSGILRGLEFEQIERIPRRTRGKSHGVMELGVKAVKP